MSELPPDNKLLDQCRVCSKRLILNSTRQGSKHDIFKSTKCCNKHSALHIKCDSKFALVMDALYNFDVSTYEDDKNTSLYCFLYEKMLLLW